MSEHGSRSFLTLIGQQAGETGRAMKYDPAMCDQVRMMAQEGMLPEEWCAHIGISMATLYRWANEHPEWEDAVVIGWHLLAAFYAKKARGLMARYAIDHGVEKAEDLKAFDSEGYRFQKSASSDTEWVFSRPQPPPPSAAKKQKD